MDIDSGPESNTWHQKQPRANSTDRSDSPAYSTQGSPLLGGDNTRLPTYISQMDPTYNSFPGMSATNQPNRDKMQELARENEELRAALTSMQEQMREANQPPQLPVQADSAPLIGNRGQSNLHDWILRQQLKRHTIPKFAGGSDHEAVLLWTDAVTHFALLAGMDNNATITAAWTAVSPEVLIWFRTMLEPDYSYKFVHVAVNYPFSWDAIRVKFVH